MSPPSRFCRPPLPPPTIARHETKAERRLSAIPRRKPPRGGSSSEPPEGASACTPAEPDLSHITEQLRPFAVLVGNLNFDPANARTHDEPNLDAIRGSLAVYGQRKPVVVNKRTNAVEAGNGTLQAALSLGWSHVAAIYVDDDAATAAGFSIADNRSSELAGWDAAALKSLMGVVSTGNDERLDAMLADLAKAEKLLEQEPAAGEAEEQTEDLAHEPEDALDLLFKSPFPYFGGKARIAKAVWRRFGPVENYVEPFFGSGAVLLNRPQPFTGTETVNDADGFVANFWRALQADPGAVAAHADWPVNENDLHARHAWLVAQKDTMQAQLEGDPAHFDAKVAGWWAWGMACWIGGGFCSGNGPWQVVEAEDGSRQLVHLGDAGRGVKRQRVHLSGAGQGVKRQLVHLGDAGQGVNRKRVHLSGAGRGDEPEARAGLGENGLLAWMQALAERLRRVRVCCGDWTRVCGGDSGDAIRLFFGGGPTCGIFLDPPYADTATCQDDLYRVDSSSVAHAVREWAIKHGDNPKLRIALAGYEGEHKMPGSWKCLAWKAAGGYAQQAEGEGNGKINCHRERLWFSPHCLAPE